MKSKTFNIKLKVLTPIHIGDGNSYDPTDYTIDKNELHVIDHDRFIQKINSNKTLYDDFLERIKNFTPESIGLINFIREQSKGLYKYSLKLDEKALEYVAKSLNEISKAPIDKFIRNPFNDTIYIPGSSIKGALRSAIIEVIFRKLLPNKEDKSNDSERRNKLLESLIERNSDLNKHNDKGKLLETLLTTTFKLNDAKNDILKHVLVSDFLPSEASLQICFPINKSSTKENNIPALLECAMPGSTFEGTITFKNQFFDELDKILDNIANIRGSSSPKKDLLHDFDGNLLAKWIRANYKDKVLMCEKETTNYSLSTKDNNFVLKIGKHAGALSKSIAGLRKIKVNAFDPEIGRKEIKIEDSQTTFWYINNKPMGWVLGEVISSSHLN
ncbi:MAG: type III-A CRISPR-associated RAMP protein Csm5 [Desulfurella sp.]|uniref:type III-A CRISPR-associated RAMP protein Csm5 n=1 Tax=Desulfurella sp. TaxID=1962857 RepID=UPI003D1219C6